MKVSVQLQIGLKIVVERDPEMAINNIYIGNHDLSWQTVEELAPILMPKIRAILEARK